MSRDNNPTGSSNPSYSTNTLFKNNGKDPCGAQIIRETPNSSVVVSSTYHGSGGAIFANAEHKIGGSGFVNAGGSVNSQGTGKANVGIGFDF